MKMRHLYTLAIVLLLLLLAYVSWYLFMKKQDVVLHTYSNTTYGVSFSYPDTYKLTETKAQGAQSGTIVTLLEKGATIPKDGEGPTAITIGMYNGMGTSSSPTLLSWVRSSPYANFNLSKTATPGTTTVGNQPALLYTWDGLYQGTSLATTYKGNVILFTVTYNGETDLKKRSDFTDLIASVRWGDVTSGTTTRK